MVWTNEYGPNKTRIFSTTLGHNNQTVGDARYLDLISRAVLWVTGNLQEEATAADRSVSLFNGKDLDRLARRCAGRPTTTRTSSRPSSSATESWSVSVSRADI